MPSIVPKNPAPIPPPGTGAFGLPAAMATGLNAGGNIGFSPRTTYNPAPGQPWSEYNPKYPPPYQETDWTRLGGMKPIYGETEGEEPGPVQYWMPQEGAAIPPGFSEASIPSKYGVAWHGAAFGPQGRLASPAEKRYPPGGGQGEGPGTGTFNPGPTSTGPLPEQPIGPWPTGETVPMPGGEQPIGPWPKTNAPGTGTYQPAPWGPIPTNPPPLPGPNGPIPIGPGGVPQLPPPPVPMPTEPVTTYVPVGRPGTGTVKQPTNQWWVQPKTVNTTYKPR